MNIILLNKKIIFDEAVSKKFFDIFKVEMKDVCNTKDISLEILSSERLIKDSTLKTQHAELTGVKNWSLEITFFTTGGSRFRFAWWNNKPVRSSYKEYHASLVKENEFTKYLNTLKFLMTH